ncbi:hypothetical protein EAF04_004373 [Stromatinia cepivora]|nr:hypothetical protein EAF04_004373 [Stromatinia cepivora]
MRFLYGFLALGAFAVTTVFGAPLPETEMPPNRFIIKNLGNEAMELHFRSEFPESMKKHKMMNHNIQIGPKQVQMLEVPSGWSGNFNAFVIGSAEKDHRTLAEFTFPHPDGNNPKDPKNQHKYRTWYDVSAVDTHEDQDGVHFVYPYSKEGRKAGCETFPCDEAYRHSKDDKNTMFTEDTTMVVEIYPTTF